MMCSPHTGKTKPISTRRSGLVKRHADEHRKAVWRVPSAACVHREAGIERVLPADISDPPSPVRVWQQFKASSRVHSIHELPTACSKLHMSLHAFNTVRVSPLATKSSNEMPANAATGHRTTAGMRRRLR